MTDANLNMRWARALIEELHHGGVRHICVAPGSRSTPLTLAAVAHPGVTVHSHLDERAASFFALGVGRATGSPCAMICTSGTAAAHAYPAVIEASADEVPLAILSADRPPELRDSGAGQVIDQQHLFGRYPRAFYDPGTPFDDALALRHLRSQVSRLTALARGDGHTAPGPVHLNMPFREPLAPSPGDILSPDDDVAALGRGQAPMLSVPARQRALGPREAEALRALVASARRGVIVCGPARLEPPEREALLELARQTGFVLLADPLSTLRYGPKPEGLLLSAHYDLILRAPARREALRPDVVLRFGAQPTSKVYRFWRQAQPQAREILVDRHAHLARDEVVQAEALIGLKPSELPPLQAETDPDWRARWAALEAEMRQLADGWTGDGLFWEGHIARTVHDMLPPEACLLAASSMPVRDVDAFAPGRASALDVVANRGANGIDGLISTTFGLAAARAPRETVALLGDVAFLHDAGALVAASRCRGVDGEPLRATLVVINNSGGGIFNYLPIAEAPPAGFEEHFLTRHEVRIAPIAAAYGLASQVVDDGPGLRRALKWAADQPGVKLIEARVDMAANVARHRAIWEEVRDGR